VYRYVESVGTFQAVPAAGGVSAEPGETDAKDSLSWAENLWADMLI
jgi:hypothetical protein